MRPRRHWHKDWLFGLDQIVSFWFFIQETPTFLYCFSSQPADLTISNLNTDQIATAEDGPTPDYETRLALVKLLLETAMYDEAFTVLNGLIEENDQVPDTLYLFGWANYIAAEEVDEKAPNADEERREQLENAREALNACVKVSKLKMEG